MPEEQNIRGDNWNRQLNKFLKTVLGWQQLGQSGTDITDPKTGKPRGLDSVFAYYSNSHTPQQIVLVEAKTIEILKNVNRGKIQQWMTTFFGKLESLTTSREFKEKFQPDTDAHYQLGLIGLWVRDVDSFSDVTLQRWLSEIHLPERKVCYHIGLISNNIISRFCAVFEEVERLKESKYKDLEFYIPDYGNKPSADGKSLPIEVLFSKFIFCRGEKDEEIRGRHISIPTSIAFYFGEINTYDDLHFIGLALKQFQLLKSDEVILYILRDSEDMRNQIARFRDSFPLAKAKEGIEVKQFVPKNKLPTWITEND